MNAAGPVAFGRLAAAALAGALLGGALGYVDLLFLARFIDFERAKNFEGLPGEIVGGLIVGLNACCGDRKSVV